MVDRARTERENAARGRAQAAWRTILTQARSYGEQIEDTDAALASEDALDALEARVGRELPIEFRAVFGTCRGSSAHVLPEGAWLRSVEEIGEAWDQYAALADEMYEDVARAVGEAGTHVDAPYDRSWIPFATREDFEIWIDLEPGPAGKLGQVLYPVGEASVVVIADDLVSFLERWAEIRSRGEVAMGEMPYPLPPEDSSFVELFRRRPAGGAAS